MKLKLITDGKRRHAVVTEHGDVVRGVRSFDLHIRAHETPVATLQLIVDVELRATEEVPKG